MTDVHVGDTVSLLTTGHVVDVSSTYITLAGENGHTRMFARKLVDIEVIKRAEPQYVRGAFYLADDGVIYQYDTDIDPDFSNVRGWYKWGGERVDFHVPKRPLRRMVPQAAEQDKASL